MADQAPSLDSQMRNWGQPSNVAKLVGHGNVQQSQLAQTLAVGAAESPEFVGPAILLEGLQRFILVSIDSALVRTKTSGQGQQPRLHQASDGLKLDSQEREEDRLAW